VAAANDRRRAAAHRHSRHRHPIELALRSRPRSGHTAEAIELFNWTVAVNAARALQSMRLAEFVVGLCRDRAGDDR